MDMVLGVHSHSTKVTRPSFPREGEGSGNETRQLL